MFTWEKVVETTVKDVGIDGSVTIGDTQTTITINGQTTVIEHAHTTKPKKREPVIVPECQTEKPKKEEIPHPCRIDAMKVGQYGWNTPANLLYRDSKGRGYVPGFQVIYNEGHFTWITQKDLVRFYRAEDGIEVSVPKGTCAKKEQDRDLHAQSRYLPIVAWDEH